MRAASPVISLSFAGCLLASTPAHAMGFGRVANGTQLGQPLEFSAVVKLDPDEALARECVFADVVAGDNRISPGLVRVALSGAPGETERVVRVSTSTPIDEPVVTVNVTLGCTSRVTRQFVAFVDPPGLALAPPAAPLVPVPPVAAAASVADGAPAPGPVAAVPVSRRDADSRVATGKVASSAEPVRKRPVPARVVAAPAGPRLQLDAPSVAVAAPPAAAASTAVAPTPAAASAVVAAPPVVAAAAPASAPNEAAAARERERIQALEDELAGLRSEARSQRQALAALQVQVGATRSQRYANPLVYTLAALCLLLTTIVCGLLGRRSRDRAAARWLTSTMLARSAEPAGGTPARPSPLAVVPPSPEAVAPGMATTAPSAAAVSPAAAASQTGGRVEELIDLEQQADFFIALGQDDAAIELLSGHVGSGDGVSSPMPLLKLLELYQRAGDRSRYDRVRGRIDRHFNARTPAFGADPGRGRSLDDDPGVVARLQALWPVPARALEALDGLVLRRGRSSETFDLPAFRELLFLQAIAADHVGRAGIAVDPFAAAEPEPAGAPTAASTPTALSLPRALDLDLTQLAGRLAAPRVPAPGRPLPVLTAAAPPFDGTETVPSALRRPADYASGSAFVDLELEFPALAAEPTLPR